MCVDGARYNCVCVCMCVCVCVGRLSPGRAEFAYLRISIPTHEELRWTRVCSRGTSELPRLPARGSKQKGVKQFPLLTSLHATRHQTSCMHAESRMHATRHATLKGGGETRNGGQRECGRLHVAEHWKGGPEPAEILRLGANAIHGANP